MEQNPEVPQKPEESAGEETQSSADAWLPVEQEGEKPLEVLETAAESVVETSGVVATEVAEASGRAEEGVAAAEEVVYETAQEGKPPMPIETSPEAEIPSPSPAYEEPTMEKPLQPEIMGPSGSTLPPKKSNNAWVTALIILLVLCCCCVAMIWFGVFFARVLGGVFLWVYELVISILNSIFGGVIQFY